MEPLSITASIAGLLAFTSKVIQYLSAVEDSSTTCQRLLSEVTSTSGLLYHIKDMHDRSAVPADWSLKTKALMTPKGPLDQSKHALELLERRLVPAGNRTIDHTKKSLTWFFQKREIQDLLDGLERQTSFFMLAL